MPHDMLMHTCYMHMHMHVCMCMHLQGQSEDPVLNIPAS